MESKIVLPAARLLQLRYAGEDLRRNLFRCFWEEDTDVYERKCEQLWNAFDKDVNQLKVEFTFPDADRIYTAFAGGSIPGCLIEFRKTPGYNYRSNKAQANPITMLSDFYRFLAEGLSGDRALFTYADMKLKLDAVCQRAA